jgi:serine/threonine protein kinase
MEQSGGEVDLGIVGVGSGTLIGQGGSAKVYRAHQEHLDRDVAVKIIAAYGDAAIQRRFERERRAMGRLSSVSGILTVYDAGINAAGDLYLVMPLERGGSFKDRIEAHGPLRWDEACYVMEQVAEAIHEAHRQGIVHRDIKPGNILISGSGRPLVADFGIARPMLDAGIDLHRH